MKKLRALLIIAVACLMSGVVLAQSDNGYRFRGDQGLGLSVAAGSFSLGDQERYGPVLTLQYTPNKHSFPSVDFFLGALIQSGSSGIVDTRNMVPVQSYFTPYYSPFSDYRNDNYFRSPNFSIGLAFLGSDVTFFMSEGSVRPYVGLGGSLSAWSVSNRFSGTIAPDAKAGLDVHMNSSLSGFLEVKRMFGVPNLFGWNTPKFDGFTSAALGLSFAPRLR